jgi:hypothetical protein
VSAATDEVYTVTIRSSCRACAMAIAGHVSKLGTIRAVFVTQPQADRDVPLTLHANAPRIKSHDGSACACPEHGKVLDISRDPGGAS